ncbi:hypothetical protein DW955_21700 [Ruminococcus sp. AM45-9BH]|nr:hypothetical protein DW955_21700 [Ruminococcus sp. AM45-9BH]
MKIFKYEEYTIAQDSKRDFTIVEKNNNFFKLDNATFDSLFGNWIMQHLIHCSERKNWSS